ncbi:MAG: chemotaxis protein CheX [Proteobacteria bacterium]|nr:chemotaxis protein CheX [Pseudomonadota bacterium]
MPGLLIDQKLLDCVINSTIEGLEMTEIQPDAIGASKFNTSSREITVIVGLHGQSNGNMVLNMSQHTANFIAGKLLGDELKELDEDSIDAICEIGNMVAGRFKDHLIGTEFEFSTISLPALVFGANYNFYHLKNITTVSVTFEISEVSIVHHADKFFTTTISLLGQS